MANYQVKIDSAVPVVVQSTSNIFNDVDGWRKVCKVRGDLTGESVTIGGNMMLSVTTNYNYLKTSSFLCAISLGYLDAGISILSKVGGVGSTNTSPLRGIRVCSTTSATDDANEYVVEILVHSGTSEAFYCGVFPLDTKIEEVYPLDASTGGTVRAEIMF